MDLRNLKFASTYVNNQLLARGLLKNAEPIDFAEPDKGHGRTEGTLARILNLVNDMVTRLDKDAGQREEVAETLREMRTTETKQAAEIERLERKNAELSRILALAQGQERSFKATIKSAEATTRGLKEQLQRLKASVQQIRNQCATDIRKKDVELSKLKSHLSERQRGKRDGPTVITISAGTQWNQRKTKNGGGISSNTLDPTSSLKQETNEFLSRLCQELSDENEAMTKIVRNTIETLKCLPGLAGEALDSAQDEQLADSDKVSESRAPQPVTPQYKQLADEIAQVLHQLTELLTSSSYVPLEELEARDDEIQRLREGWEKMELRWKEALRMMDNRMAADDYGSIANSGVTHTASNKADLDPFSTTKLKDQQGRKSPVNAVANGDQKEENIAPKHNSESWGRKLRPRLSKAASDAPDKFSESQAVSEVSVAKQLPRKRASTNSQLSIIEEEVPPTELRTQSAAPQKSPAKPSRSSKVIAQSLNKGTPKSKSTNQALASPVKPSGASTVVAHAQKQESPKNDLVVPAPDSGKSRAKPFKGGNITSAEVQSVPAAPAQTPAPQKSPTKEDSARTNFSREETIVLQRNAEHKNITKRRRDSKVGKKPPASRAARATGVTSKPTPAKRQAEKQTPDAKATPLSKKRKTTPADAQSRTKRRRSARLADGAVH